MKRKSLSQVLREVDPELTVIPGGSYRHGKRRKAVKLGSWDNCGGALCPECRQEVVQLVNGVCVQCFRQKEASREEALEVKTMRNYYRRKLREGTISLGAMREGDLGDSE